MRHYVNKIRTSSLHEILGLVYERSSRVLRQSAQSLVATLVPSLINNISGTQCDLNLSDERTINRLKDVLQGSFFWSWSEKEEIIGEYRRFFKNERIESVLNDADEICKHIFDFQGSGKKELGKKIQWRQDLSTGCRWPKYKAREVPVILRKGSDIVRVWELSRFQWGPTLGKAYWLTDDERYVKVFLGLVHHWCRENPIGYGPNWMTGQDAALRAINWIMTLTFIGGSNAVTTKSWRDIFQMLFLHGVFIREHLTIRYRDGKRVTGNHYASQLLGLFILGLLFRCSQKGQEWLEYSVRELDLEMTEQVFPDGAQYESSIACYHRFVLEHFLAAYLLSLRNGIHFSLDYSLRLEKMFGFIEGYTRPDGSVPHIGDTDDARLFKLMDYASWDKDNHLFMLYMFRELYDKVGAGLSRERFGEESFWMMHRLKKEKFLPVNGHLSNVLDIKRSASFSDSGFYFMKSKDNYMAISANPVGLKGKGNHKHNDILSFDLFMNGECFIVDPGSYVYTSDTEQRNIFRSTSYHNTIMVDDEEINPFTAQGIFQMDEKAFPHVRKWESVPEYDYFEGMHFGYTRLMNPVIHERRILFIKKNKTWLIQDSIHSDDHNESTRLKGETPVHKINVYFHFSPLECTILEEHEPWVDLSFISKHDFNLRGYNIKIPTVIAKKKRSSIVIQLLNYPEYAKIYIEKGWVSPSYGVKMDAPILRIDGSWSCPISFVYLISPVNT